jgi:hypothetical protein
VSFKELRNAGEEKDATILKLQQAAETARANLETENKQVEGKSPLSYSLSVAWVHQDLLSTYLSFAFRTRAALGMSTTQAEALQATYNSSQWELEVLQEAALEACQSVNEGARQAGSSMATRLRALGGLVARRMRGALRLGIQKILGVVQSQYQIDVAALATSCLVADDLDDDGAEAEVNRLDAIATPAADILANDFEEVLFPNTPPGGPLEP